MSATISDSTELPSWKEDFLSKPSISVRKSIADNYDAPYEDTDTLVLTAPSGIFVDVRFPKKMLRDQSGLKRDLQASPSFWAFSGISNTTFYDPKNGQPGLEYTAHTVFTHDIDSKGPGITDEGDCFLLPNGDCMEVGIWSHNKQLYKEVWTSPQPLPSKRAVDKYPVIVAETVEHGQKGRGIMIRIGDYIQGLYESPDASAQGRRIFVCRIVNTELGWMNDWRSNWWGEGSLLPCELLMEDGCHIDMEWTAVGSKWKITEYQSTPYQI